MSKNQNKKQKIENSNVNRNLKAINDYFGTQLSGFLNKPNTLVDFKLKEIKTSLPKSWVLSFKGIKKILFW